MKFSDIAADAFERLARRHVAAAFEAKRALPDAVAQVPLIGGEYDPHAPPEKQAELQERAVRALCCIRWAETEVPPWMLPIPIKAEDHTAVFAGKDRYDRRAWLRSEYGRYLEDFGWHIENVPPFEEFCAGKLCPNPPPHEVLAHARRTGRWHSV